MKRKAYDKILEWKAKFAGKYALMLDGPRRVGKSWLAETFAQAEYKAYVLIDFSKVKVLAKTKTGRRKNVIPLEVKSGVRTTHASLDKFCKKFRTYTDQPTLLDAKDYKVDGNIAHFPLYAAPALLEQI